MNFTASKTAAELQKEEQQRQLLELKKKADDTLKLLEETMGMLVKRGGANAAENAAGNEISQQALAGDIDMECPSPAKIVRIFTSSTFTGM